jgi:hypothetical protein
VCVEMHAPTPFHERAATSENASPNVPLRSVTVSLHNARERSPRDVRSHVNADNRSVSTSYWHEHYRRGVSTICEACSWRWQPGSVCRHRPCGCLAPDAPGKGMHAIYWSRSQSERHPVPLVVRAPSRLGGCVIPRRPLNRLVPITLSRDQHPATPPRVASES